MTATVVDVNFMGESSHGDAAGGSTYNVPAMSEAARPRHSAVVRITHWLTALAFMALLVTGVEVLLSHPRFYWGESGNLNTRPLFSIPVPSSRSMVFTGYGFVLPDQNGWSRYLHVEAAWLSILTGVVYVAFAVYTGHVRRSLLPSLSDLAPGQLAREAARRLRFSRATDDGDVSYNLMQRLTYLLVVFVLFPLVIWTGLAMSPAFESVFGSAAAILGGRQSARTLHFFVSILLLVFLVVHVLMVSLAGFRRRVGAMITGRVART